MATVESKRRTVGTGGGKAQAKWDKIPGSGTAPTSNKRDNWKDQKGASPIKSVSAKPKWGSHETKVGGRASATSPSMSTRKEIGLQSLIK